MISTLNKTQDVVATVQALVKEHGITSYGVTMIDVMAENFTRLSGNDVPHLDEVQLSILALRRAGHLNKFEAMDLQASYLCQKSL